MRIQIDLARPRWLRLPRTWRIRALLTLALAGVVAVPVAWASHRFGDVPNSNPHHDDVSAIRDAGITTGCNPPANTLYCPDHLVRRDQMASFLRRGYGRVALTMDVNDRLIEPSSGAETDTVVAEVEVVVPGAGAGATQFVQVDAHVQVVLEDGSPPFGILYYVADTTCASGNQSEYWATAIRDEWAMVLSLTWATPAPPGSRTFQLCAFTQGLGNTARVMKATLNAATFPFGWAGGSVLGTEQRPLDERRRR